VTRSPGYPCGACVFCTSRRPRGCKPGATWPRDARNRPGSTSIPLSPTYSPLCALCFWNTVNCCVNLCCPALECCHESFACHTCPHCVRKVHAVLLVSSVLFLTIVRARSAQVTGSGRAVRELSCAAPRTLSLCEKRNLVARRDRVPWTALRRFGSRFANSGFSLFLSLSLPFCLRSGVAGVLPCPRRIVRVVMRALSVLCGSPVRRADLGQRRANSGFSLNQCRGSCFSVLPLPGLLGPSGVLRTHACGFPTSRSSCSSPAIMTKAFIVLAVVRWVNAPSSLCCITKTYTKDSVMHTTDSH
jgi:hypothetical protein